MFKVGDLVTGHDCQYSITKSNCICEVIEIRDEKYMIVQIKEFIGVKRDNYLRDLYTVEQIYFNFYDKVASHKTLFERSKDRVEKRHLLLKGM